MMSNASSTNLAAGNAAFREGRYVDAMELYQHAAAELPAFTRGIKFNSGRALKNLNRRLNPTAMNPENIGLAPVHQALPHADKGGYWISTGDDPHFSLTFPEKPVVPAGWYEFRLLMDSSSFENVAKLYADHGEGYSEVNMVKLAPLANSVAVRVLHFAHPVVAMRFDPVEREGNFRIISLELKSINEAAALQKMLNQLQVSRNTKGSRAVSASATRAAFVLQAAESKKNLIDVVRESYEQIFIKGPNKISYADWIRNVESESLPDAGGVLKLLSEMDRQPLISVVMPTYNTDEIWLTACIQSVMRQSYPNWELCIADDASTKPHVRKVLESFGQKDHRIKLVFRKKNGHISRATNSALEIASGEFVALLDHDDALPEHALLFMAQAINKNPGVQIIYSDEDKITEEGERFDPHFKTDWNPDLFYSQNYVSHLGMFNRKLLETVEGFRAGVEGSQDQDLLLRCLHHVQPSQIVHIPRVLYHWRSIEGSTALAAGQKSFTGDAGLKSLRDHFKSVRPDVTVESGLLPNTYRVCWPVPAEAPLASLLIPTRDRRELTETCIRSIIDKSTYQNFEILILDNGSVEPDTMAFFEQIQVEDSRVRVLRYDHPFNYSAINNFGVANARGSIIGLVNNDIEVINPGWLHEMVSQALRPDIGCVGAKLYFGNGQIQHAGMIVGIGGVAGHSHKYFGRDDHGYFSRLKLVQNISGNTAACLLIRREIYEEVAGLDEVNLHVAFNDVDFCLKVRSAGYRNLWTPYAELYHHESISRGTEDTPDKQARFQKEVRFMQSKWGAMLRNDPYYNPNLTQEREDFWL